MASQRTWRESPALINDQARADRRRWTGVRPHIPNLHSQDLLSTLLTEASLRCTAKASLRLCQACPEVSSGPPYFGRLQQGPRLPNFCLQRASTTCALLGLSSRPEGARKLCPSTPGEGSSPRERWETGLSFPCSCWAPWVHPEELLIDSAVLHLARPVVCVLTSGGRIHHLPSTREDPKTV